VELIHRRGPAWGLFVTVLLLGCIGVVMVYSASAVVAQAQYHDSAWFLKRQLLYTVLGLVAMSVAWRLHYDKLRALTLPLLGLTLLTSSWCSSRTSAGRRAGRAAGCRSADP